MTIQPMVIRSAVSQIFASMIPVKRGAAERYDFQLLQMCSDFGRDSTKIMWGDAGICHFFINSEKLKNCDFRDVLYYCDCC